jgi:glyceraldehyde 3-phosphate dehydrogenase
MTVYALNGLGRIGKLALKPLLERGARIAWINDAVGDPAMHAHLLEFDTVHGRWDAAFAMTLESVTSTACDCRSWARGTCRAAARRRRCGDRLHRRLQDRGKARPLFRGGREEGRCFGPGEGRRRGQHRLRREQDIYDAAHRIVTAASCTTNCLAPVVKVIHEAIGIRHGSITTIHDVTNTQTIVDRPAKDLRRARSALNSLIPTTTGSATAITLIYPELKGRLNGHAVRVPLLNASLTDCVFEVERATTVEEVNALFKAAADGPLKGILGYEERPLVSADYTNDTRSSDRRCALDHGGERHAGEGLRLV